MENSSDQYNAEFLSQILESKKTDALKQWAIEQMGDSYKSRLEKAEYDFLLSTFALMSLRGMDFHTAVQVAPFGFARSLCRTITTHLIPRLVTYLLDSGLRIVILVRSFEVS